MTPPKIPDNMQVIRLTTPSEFENIVRMQRNAKEFTTHYPKHVEWLTKAISEMNKGIRVAYGLFGAAVDKNSGKPILKLHGSIIIKKGKYSSVVEMKNMFVEESARRNGGGYYLYKEIEDYCRRKGYSTIETEVPCEEFKTIRFLHKNGFRVTKCMDSRFKENDQIYLMEKRITPTFSGDPFNFEKICEWYVKQFWGYKYVPSESTKSYQIWHPDVRKRPHYGEAPPLELSIATIFCPTCKNLKEVLSAASSNADAIVLFCEDDQDLNALKGLKFKSVKRQQIYSAIQGDSGYEIPNFEQKEIAGMIVSFNPEVFRDLIAKHPEYENKDEHIPYYKGGPIGRYVQRGHSILLFEEGGENSGTGSIRGFAKVTATYVDTPDVVKTSLSDLPALIDKDRFDRIFSTKKEIVGFALDSLKFISPIEKDEIFRLFSNGKQFELNDIGHRYISQKQLNEFMKTKNEVQTKSAKSPPKISESFD